MDTNERAALITGASAGIGHAFARVFAAAGYRLLLVARNATRLDAVTEELQREYGVAARAIAVDLTEPDAVATLLGAVRAAGVDITALVNCAGIGATGPVAELSSEQQLDVLRVNVSALTELTRALLPTLLRAPRGEILNVASSSAFHPLATKAVYAATKAYVLSFTLGLADELRDSDIRVTCLCPGPTATGFSAAAGTRESWLFRLRRLDAMTVARAGFRGLERGQRVVVPGFLNRALLMATRWIPRSVVRGVFRLLNPPATSKTDC